MSKQFFKKLGLIFSVAISMNAFADTQSIRWTGNDDSNSEYYHILDRINASLGTNLGSSDFLATEDRDLAFTHYKRFSQLVDGVPVQGMSLRIWTDRDSGATVQVEALVEGADSLRTIRTFLSQKGISARHITSQATSSELMRLTRVAVQEDGSDTQIQDVKWSDAWVDPRTNRRSSTLVRTVRAKARRGTHIIEFELPSLRILRKSYEEFPQQDVGSAEFSLPAQIYPIYELAENGTQVLQRAPGMLNYIRAQVPRPTTDIYSGLATQRYFDTNMDPVLGETESGRSQGFWSMSYIKRQAFHLRSQLALNDNTFAAGGVILDGRYATINLHPAVARSYQGLSFTPAPSSVFKPNWIESEASGNSVAEMIPGGSLLGRPLSSFADAWERPARILPNHDPASYINDGFDEVQVYYAINTLFDSLKENGWSDPELSTRPFNAFLYDPDISMKDNAFYTDDTINFTTYSPGAPNFARDNPTIWHELGHGVMDRMMGDNLHLADTGGLSEGMADFVAALVIQGVTQGRPFPGHREFRIINHTGFFLTNEVHDDGEAYGGAMKDMLDAAVAADSQNGLKKMVDLTLEAMRLCRDNPGLTAKAWFEHMLFADELGRPGVRDSGEMRQVILSSLAGRNFRMDDQPVAKLTLMNLTSGQEVTDAGLGSRRRPLPVHLEPSSSVTYDLSVALQGTDQYQFHYPVTVKVQLRGGPIQGAIHWANEESQPLLFTLNSESDVAHIPLTASGTCDYSNRDDGSCVDYAYVQIWNNGETDKPVAKKRFYLKISN